MVRPTSVFNMIRLGVVLWMFSAVLCMKKGKPAQNIKGSSTVSMENEILSVVTSANKDFAFNLFKKLAVQTDSQGKNIFFSPISVSVALAALSVGARGETRQQLLDGLSFGRYNLAQKDINLAFQKLLRNSLSDEDLNEGVGVFVDKKFKPEQEFLDVLKQYYLADGFSVDFKNTMESVDVINGYVSNKTNGKINDLVKDLDARTLMILVSYIYYKGMWKTPFDASLTKEDTFTVEENTTVSVQMMNRNDQFEVYIDFTIDTKVLYLPLNGTYSMLLLLPENMTTLENSINQAAVRKWMTWKSFRTCDVYVPKFSIKTSYDLNKILAEMGIASIFSDSADLRGISENVAVSKIMHHASLDVDEVGATAAAVTDVTIVPLSLFEPLVLKFNRPFMVVILDMENILFMGKIVNPTI